MSRIATRISLVVCACAVALAGGALAQDTSVIPNMTNACIDSTYKLFSPNMAAPTFVLIDRRLTVNPLTACTTAGSNSAACQRDSNGPGFLLIASASGAQLMNNPSCSWNCGACGTIITDSGDGLPVELMEFSVEVEDERDAEDVAAGRDGAT